MFCDITRSERQARFVEKRKAAGLRRVQFWLDVSTVEALEKAAKKRGCSVSELLQFWGERLTDQAVRDNADER